MAQLAFLLYLFLGQVVLLGVWLLLPQRSSGEADPRRLARFGFAVYWLVGQVALFVGWAQLAGLWKAAGAVGKADMVILLHFGFMLFVLALQLLILVGWPLGWKWTRGFSLRLLHLICIEIVVGQSVVGLECPLTSLERDLRGSLLPEDPRDSDAGVNARLAATLVAGRSENFLTSLALLTWTADTLEDPKSERLPYVGWVVFYRSQLHNLEGASPLARFCHNLLLRRIPREVYPYVAGSFGLLILLTWVFVPPRMPGHSSRSR